MDKDNVPENLELAGLQGLAAEVDGQAATVAAPGDPNAPELPAPGPDYGAGARQTVDMFGALAVGFVPEAAPLWGDDTKARMSASLAPVFEKYGWDMAGAMPCELVAIVTCGPVLWQTSRLVAAKVEAAKAQAAATRGQSASTLQAADVIDPAEKPEGSVHPQMALYK
ncbi:hypothetical protein D9X30_4897 [Cupriavidus sp. U2]|uniref:hypothetical protein n=1 Tax=Cupriavidus sp. U2 TaxID=2920269 RepID=UPI00129EDC52|nr:hypothetical protein [Cupriavidus sp. U2]KAI3589314.1 hypothetical protein D9X30_4897 [Cupriavidus sp. U2]